MREPRRRSFPQAVSNSLDAAKLGRVLAHIDEHLESELSVETLAELAGISASCFARAFRQALAVTPHAYVLKARVERAKRLIRETDLALVEVALAVGFSSQACLNVAFRRHAGTTPGRFRAQDSRKAKDPSAASVRSSVERRSRSL